MALATRCPHCNTTFRVVEDQLKLYSGIVRCGVCHEIFNATDYIVDDSAPANTGSPVSSRETATEATQPEPTQKASEPVAPVIEPTIQEDHSAIPSATSVAPPPGQTFPFALEAAKEPPATPVQGSSDNAADNDDRIELDIPDHPFSEADQPPTFPLEIDDLSIEDLSEKILREGKYDPMAAEGLQPFENTASRIHEEDWRSISLDLGNSHEQETTPFRAEPFWQAPAQPEPIAPSDFDSHVADPAQQDIAIKAGESSLSPVDTQPSVQTATDDYVVSLGDNKGAESDTGIAIEEPTQPHEPGFVKRAKKRQRSSRAMRWILSLGSLVLLVLLVLQGIYAFHDRIVVLVPQAEPAVVEICDVLDCETRLAARIDELSIDSNELQSLPNRPDTYTLDVVLHNTSSSTQEWPHLELTLNDESGQPSLRHVFTPETYLAGIPESANVSISKGFAPQSEQQIKLVFTLDQIKAAGYRVYIFYP